MSVTLVATAGAANANSYLTIAEATAYFDTRLHSSAWDDAEEPEKALMMATRVLDRMALPLKEYIESCDGSCRPHYRTRPQWTGAPSTTTQALAWPRTGMYDHLGNAIPDNVVPTALKEATAELAMQLVTSDRTLDSDVEAQGITSMRAGSVALTFKELVSAKVIPDAVWNLMVPSWFTDVIIEYVRTAEFEVI